MITDEEMDSIRRSWVEFILSLGAPRPITLKPLRVPFSVLESLPQTEQPLPSKQAPEKPDSA